MDSPDERSREDQVRREQRDDPAGNQDSKPFPRDTRSVNRALMEGGITAREATDAFDRLSRATADLSDRMIRDAYLNPLPPSPIDYGRREIHDLPRGEEIEIRNRADVQGLAQFLALMVEIHHGGEYLIPAKYVEGVLRDYRLIVQRDGVRGLFVLRSERLPKTYVWEYEEPREEKAPKLKRPKNVRKYGRAKMRRTDDDIS